MPVVFVLIDNDGGGIFHMLPIAEHEPHFTLLFATPHGIDLARAPGVHGIECTTVAAEELESAVAARDAPGNDMCAARRDGSRRSDCASRGDRARRPRRRPTGSGNREPEFTPTHRPDDQA